ncbi:MAG: aldose 1-epimerase family protein [Acidimicrobiia bacterium]
MSADERVGPVGRLHELVAGDQRVVVSESGATVRAYEVAGRAVIEPFDGPDTPPIGCQGQLLAPWPNRVVDGRWSWESTPQQLWITEPERGHALHGLVRTLAWAPVGHRPGGITLAATLLAHPGWPFPLAFTVSYDLEPGGLVSRLTATNVGRSPCPYGAAVHPYLCLGGSAVDDVVLDLGAATYVATDDRLAPTGRHPTAGTPFAFDGSRPAGDRQVDNAFTDLARGPDGRVEAAVTTPDGRRVVVWGDASVRWWQVFTGDDLPDRYRRRTLAVEPMTCAPDALNSGDGLAVLAPGARHTMTWGVRPEPPS